MSNRHNLFRLIIKSKLQPKAPEHPILFPLFFVKLCLSYLVTFATLVFDISYIIKSIVILALYLKGFPDKFKDSIILGSPLTIEIHESMQGKDSNSCY